MVWWLAKHVRQPRSRHVGSTCRSGNGRASLGPPINQGRHAATTRERWRQVHDLLDKGVGLLECARRLNLGLNTVKRYARHTEPDRISFLRTLRIVRRLSAASKIFSVGIIRICVSKANAAGLVYERSARNSRARGS